MYVSRWVQFYSVYKDDAMAHIPRSKVNEVIHPSSTPNLSHFTTLWSLVWACREHQFSDHTWGGSPSIQLVLSATVVSRYVVLDSFQCSTTDKFKTTSSSFCFRVFYVYRIAPGSQSPLCHSSHCETLWLTILYRPFCTSLPTLHRNLILFRA